MLSSTPATHKPPAAPFTITRSPIWICAPNRLHCQHEHVRRTYREGMHIDAARLEGPAFVRCDECKECYLAVFYARPDPAVHCYAISVEQWAWWYGPEGIDFDLDARQPMQHLLALLGYNPYYRPTNPRTSRPTPP